MSLGGLLRTVLATVTFGTLAVLQADRVELRLVAELREVFVDPELVLGQPARARAQRGGQVIHADASPAVVDSIMEKGLAYFLCFLALLALIKN